MQQETVVHDRGTAIVSGTGDISYKVVKYEYQIDSERRPLPGVEPPLASAPKVRGREALLTELDGVLDTPAPHFWVLHGLGGTGKSAVALTLAGHARDRGFDVFWVRGESAIDQAMLSIAERCGASPEQVDRARANYAEVAHLAWQALDSAPRPWLLVVDDVDDPTVLGRDGDLPAAGTGWVRPNSHGTVVVTSRNGDSALWGDGGVAALRRLDPLDTEAAVEILFDLAPHAAPADDPEAGHAAAARVAERLGGLPLALRLAGLYLAGDGAHRTFDEYRAALEENFADLIDRGAPRHARDQGSAARGAVLTTWELSLRMLEGQGMEPARPLLELLCALGADQPLRLDLLAARMLVRTAVDCGPEPLTPGYLDQVLAGLTGLGLIDRQQVEVLGSEPGPSRDGLRAAVIHPLLAEVIRAKASRSEQAAETWSLASGVLVAATPEEVFGSDGMRAWLTLPTAYAHLVDQVPADLPADLAEIVEGAVRCASHLRLTGALQQAGALATRAEQRSRELPAVHPARLTARLATAKIDSDIGVRLSAVELGGLLDDVAQAFGADHPDTIVVRAQLAESLLGANDLAGAGAQYSIIAAHQEQHGGLDQATRFGLARLAWAEGRLAEAQAAFREVLASETEHLGAEHPHTLLTRTLLAQVMIEHGDNRAGQAEAAAVLQIQERLLGPDNPMTLVARTALLTALTNLGDLTGAEGQLHQVLKIQRDSLSPEDPVALFSLVTLTNFRGLVQEQDGPEVSEARARSIGAALEALLGPEHPHVLITRFNAALYLYQYDGPGGERECADVLSVLNRVAGPENPTTLNVRLFHALMLADQDDYRADGELRALFAVQRRVLSRQHPLVLLSQQAMANLALEMGRPDEAIQLLSTVVEVRVQTDGEDDDKVVEARANLASVLAGREDYDGSEQQLRRVVTSLSRTHGPDSLETLGAQVMLGALSHERGHQTEAEDRYREVLAVLALMDQEIAETPILLVRSMLGDVLRETGRLDAARDEMSDALTGLIAGFGEDDEDAIDVQIALGQVEFERGDLVAATRLLRTAAERARSVFGDDSERALRAQAWLETTEELNPPEMTSAAAPNLASDPAPAPSSGKDTPLAGDVNPLPAADPALAITKSPVPDSPLAGTPVSGIDLRQAPGRGATAAEAPVPDLPENGPAPVSQHAEPVGTAEKVDPVEAWRLYLEGDLPAAAQAFAAVARSGDDGRLVAYAAALHHSLGADAEQAAVGRAELRRLARVSRSDPPRE